MSPTSRQVRAAMCVLLVGAGLTACSGGRREPPATPKTVFIIVDGIPADVLERTPTPNIDAIAAVGGYTRAYVGGPPGTPAESPTISAVGYMSLLTGTWANKHNVWDNDVAAPNYRYWDIFRIAKTANPALRTAVFSTWLDNRTKLIGDGLDAAGGAKIDEHVDGLELDTERFPHDEAGHYISDIDAVVATAAARHVRERGPDLTWVYLQYTDNVAHDFGDSPEFSAAVEWMDGRVGEIWSAIIGRQGEPREDWLVVATSDHGRDAQTGRTHGKQSDRERSIWIATNSRHLNTHFRQTPAIVDILPSIAVHMRLDMPADVRGQLDGRSFIERPE